MWFQSKNKDGRSWSEVIRNQSWWCIITPYLTGLGVDPDGGLQILFWVLWWYTVLVDRSIRLDSTRFTVLVLDLDARLNGNHIFLWVSVGKQCMLPLPSYFGWITITNIIMAPIRVGLIGLSSSTAAAGTNWAGLAHLPYLKASPHYEVVALLNSSVESAKEAIRKYGFSSGTKAYGDPAG
jgi:hypothetical protein